MKPIEKQKKKRGNIANLKPFKPGTSGNPKGRPRKELCLTSIVKAELESQAEKDGKLMKNPDGSPMTYAQVLGKSIVRQAAKGNSTALKELWERIDGKLPVPIQHSGDKENPVGMILYVPEEEK